MATTDKPTYSTGEGTVLWNGMFTPQLSQDPKPNEKPKYNVRLGFTAEQMLTPQFKAIKALVVATAKASVWGNKAEAMIKEGSVRLPFRTDIAAKGYPDHFKCFINLATIKQPGIVDRYPANPPLINPKTGKPFPRNITNSDEVYSGCIGQATVSARAYGGGTTGFSPGVSLDLRNFQLLNVAGVKYDRLDGRSSGEDDFGAEPAADVSLDFGSSESLPDNSKDDLNDLLS